MLNFDIQNHRSLREIVYEELKMQILTGKIVPGTRMMEVELADDMGVSRTPIREAIRQLEKEGLVTIEPRRGAYASQISVKDMVDILEVRQNLEGLAAFFAAQRMTKDVQEELHRVSENYDQAVADGDMAAMIKSDTRFHRIIVEASNNHVLLQMIEQLQELVLRCITAISREQMICLQSTKPSMRLLLPVTRMPQEKRRIYTSRDSRSL